MDNPSTSPSAFQNFQHCEILRCMLPQHCCVEAVAPSCLLHTRGKTKEANGVPSTNADKRSFSTSHLLLQASIASSVFPGRISLRNLTSVFPCGPRRAPASSQQHTSTVLPFVSEKRFPSSCAPETQSERSATRSHPQQTTHRSARLSSRQQSSNWRSAALVVTTSEGHKQRVNEGRGGGVRRGEWSGGGRLNHALTYQQHHHPRFNAGATNPGCNRPVTGLARQLAKNATVNQPDERLASLNRQATPMRHNAPAVECQRNACQFIQGADHGGQMPHQPAQTS